MTEARETTERAVVGCLLLDSRAIDSLVEQGGSASWFTGTSCRKVAQAVLTRYEQGKIASDMLAINELGLVPMSWMDECIELVPTVAHTEHYVATLKGHADKDALIALERAVSAIVSHCTPETVQEARASIESTCNATLCKGSRTAGTMTEAAHSLIDKLTAPEATTALLDWPVRSITDAVGRLRNEVVWICAQPSIGKTAFVLAILSHLAGQGHKGSLASLESDAESIAGRLISSNGPMSTTNLRQGKATLEEIAKARAAADRISDNIMVTDGSMSIDVAYAWGKAQVRHGAKLLIFDNTRYLSVPNEANRVERMATVSARMAQLRNDTGVPVIVLHHSAVNEHTGKEKASWSSDIERDADILVFLREHEENTKQPSPEHPNGEWCVSFDVAKHREGRKLVRVLLRFDKETQTFSRWVDNEYVTGEDFGDIPQDDIF
jgi:replicative DNA helicase